MALLTGNASLTFGDILDGDIAALTFSLTGASTGMVAVPAWPSALPEGLVGTMLVQSSDTIEVRLANLSGALLTLGALTFGVGVE